VTAATTFGRQWPSAAPLAISSCSSESLGSVLVIIPLSVARRHYHQQPSDVRALYFLSFAPYSQSHDDTYTHVSIDVVFKHRSILRINTLDMCA
jgi:hypothetical protein